MREWLLFVLKRKYVNHKKEVWGRGPDELAFSQYIFTLWFHEHVVYRKDLMQFWSTVAAFQ